jgi:hypothetical protein
VERRAWPGGSQSSFWWAAAQPEKGPRTRSEEVKRLARDKIHGEGVWEILDLETGNRVFTIPP